jgi:hypothetical protein
MMEAQLDNLNTRYKRVQDSIDERRTGALVIRMRGPKSYLSQIYVHVSWYLHHEDLPPLWLEMEKEFARAPHPSFGTYSFCITAGKRVSC